MYADDLVSGSNTIEEVLKYTIIKISSNTKSESEFTYAKDKFKNADKNQDKNRGNLCCCT